MMRIVQSGCQKGLWNINKIHIIKEVPQRIEWKVFFSRVNAYHFVSHRNRKQRYRTLQWFFFNNFKKIFRNIKETLRVIVYNKTKQITSFVIINWSSISSCLNSSMIHFYYQQIYPLLYCSDKRNIGLSLLLQKKKISGCLGKDELWYFI